MDNFKVIYKILSSLEAAMDYQVFDMESISPDALGISKERWEKYMEMLQKAGFVEGVRIIERINSPNEIRCSKLRITLKGLEYLSENTFMKKMYNAAKGVADLIP